MTDERESEGRGLMLAAARAEGIPESFVGGAFKPESLVSVANDAARLRVYLPQSEASRVIEDINREYIRKAWNNERLSVRAQTMPADEAKAEAEKVRPHLARIARAHGVDERVLDLIDDRIMVEIAAFYEYVIVSFLQSVAMNLEDEHAPATCNLH